MRPLVLHEGLDWSRRHWEPRNVLTQGHKIDML